MIIFITGGSGVLGRATIPLLSAAGHCVHAPTRQALDLFDPRSLRRAIGGANAVMHLASRIPSAASATDRSAWTENDRLRNDASRLLVDAALSHPETAVYVQPSVAFVYSDGPADESTPIRRDLPKMLGSALEAERHTHRFTAAGRRGVVLRLGLLYGPAAATMQPDDRFGATLRVNDAATALLASLAAPAGTYNIVDDGLAVDNAKYKQAVGWEPTTAHSENRRRDRLADSCDQRSGGRPDDRRHRPSADLPG